MASRGIGGQLVLRIRVSDRGLAVPRPFQVLCRSTTSHFRAGQSQKRRRNQVTVHGPETGSSYRRICSRDSIWSIVEGPNPAQLTGPDRESRTGRGTSLEPLGDVHNPLQGHRRMRSVDFPCGVLPLLCQRRYVTSPGVADGSEEDGGYPRTRKPSSLPPALCHRVSPGVAAEV